MAVCGSRIAQMAAFTGGAAPHDAILSATQPYYQAATSTTVSRRDFEPDRPIGYGAFGVVW